MTRLWFCRGCQIAGLLDDAERGVCWAPETGGRLSPLKREDCPHRDCRLPPEVKAK